MDQDYAATKPHWQCFDGWNWSALSRFRSGGDEV
jgi:hypothetical protein